MTTDNKTLADAQPGGRVRLGDALPPLPKMQRFTNLYGETYAYSAEQMREYARAALSAQPSPGGQGDGLVESLVQIMNAKYDGLGRLPADVLGVLNMAVEAITSRQPVGEPITVEAVATVRRNGDGDRCIDWLTEGGIADMEVGDVLMVSDRAITDEDGSGEVYAAPPAQAVDLGQEPMFYIQDTRQFVGNCPMWWGPNGSGYVTRLDEAGRYTEQEAIRQSRTRETDIPWPCTEIDALARKTVDCQHMRPRAERLAELAKVDSQAVGNG
ncbi:hypothetical protein [Stenotrophomonas forensis]